MSSPQPKLYLAEERQTKGKEGFISAVDLAMHVAIGDETFLKYLVVES